MNDCNVSCILKSRKLNAHLKIDCSTDRNKTRFTSNIIVHFASQSIGAVYPMFSSAMELQLDSQLVSPTRDSHSPHPLRNLCKHWLWECMGAGILLLKDRGKTNKVFVYWLYAWEMTKLLLELQFLSVHPAEGRKPQRHGMSTPSWMKSMQLVVHFSSSRCRNRKEFLLTTKLGDRLRSVKATLAQSAPVETEVSKLSDK